MTKTGAAQANSLMPAPGGGSGRPRAAETDVGGGGLGHQEQPRLMLGWWPGPPRAAETDVGVVARATGRRSPDPSPARLEERRGELSQVAQVGDQVVDVVFLQHVECRHPAFSLFGQRREALRLIQNRRFDQYRATARALGVRAVAGRAIFRVGGRSRPL